MRILSCPRTAIALLSGFILATTACHGQETPQQSPGAGSTPNKLALLVGINEYRDTNIRSLRGALNDVERMKSTLVGKFDFPEENVLPLRNSEATRDRILSSFRSHLIGKARNREDVVVFYFSGHGSRVVDKDGDEIADDLDETLVPWDSTNSGARDITDDEINELIKELSGKTRNITFIFDSCSSGTATRGAGALKRIDRQFNRPGESTGNSAFKDSEIEYTLIAAARSNQLAREYVSNGIPYGAFTYFLTSELDRTAGSEVTYRDVMDVVERKVQSLHVNQQPTLEGVAADSLVFGDSRVLQQKAVPVIPTASKANVFLDAGQVHGVTEGSTFEIYPPGTRIFEPPSESLTRVTVTNVEQSRSAAKLENPQSMALGSRAVLREHKFGDRKLLVYFENAEESETLASIAAELGEYSFIEIAPTEPYHLLLEHKGSNIRIEAADSGTVADIDVNEADFRTRIIDKVTAWGKWFNVLSIDNPSPPRNVGIKFSVKALTTRGKTRDPFANIGKPDAEFYSGEKIVLNIDSKSKVDLYLHVLVLSTNGSVIALPLDRDNDEDLLRKGGSASFEKFQTCLPKGYESVIDVVKIVAHTDRLDFGFLEQKPLTRGQPQSVNTDDPVEDLFANAALGAALPPQAVPLGKWISEQRVLKTIEAQDGTGRTCD